MDVGCLEALDGFALVRVVSVQTGDSRNKVLLYATHSQVQFTLCMNTELTPENHMDNMQNFEQHSLITESFEFKLQGNHT